MKGWLTLKEVEERYSVKAGTLRNYIKRGQVIPPEMLEKIGKTWVISESWVVEKYGEKV